MFNHIIITCYSFTSVSVSLTFLWLHTVTILRFPNAAHIRDHTCELWSSSATDQLLFALSNDRPHQ